jgi:hypothetical protein
MAASASERSVIDTSSDGGAPALPVVASASTGFGLGASARLRGREARDFASAVRVLRYASKHRRRSARTAMERCGWPLEGFSLPRVVLTLTASSRNGRSLRPRPARCSVGTPWCSNALALRR